MLSILIQVILDANILDRLSIENQTSIRHDHSNCKLRSANKLTRLNRTNSSPILALLDTNPGPPEHQELSVTEQPLPDAPIQAILD